MEGLFFYRLLLLAVILGLNAFFAAAEVSLVSVRPSRLKALAAEGNLGARAALDLLANPQRLLSVSQVGLTLASLGLGWAGEGTIYELLLGWIQPWIMPGSSTALHAVSFAISFLFISFCHVVIGEVVPKNLAIEKADRLAVLAAPFLLVFYRISGPFVVVVERAASVLSRWLGLRGEIHGGHSPEELKLIIRSIEGQLEQSTGEAITRLLELAEHVTREIMVPRNMIASAPVTASLDELLRVMSEQQHSRVPIWEDRPDRIIGYVHVKDMLRVWLERRASNLRRRTPPLFHVRRILRKILIVPETKSLDRLVEEFQENRTEIALVVDEFGTVSGLVTLEDVIEQIFGEIEDEFDLAPAPHEPEAERIEIEGNMPIRDLEMQFGIELPSDAGFETVAGFLLFQLGHIPSTGESVTHGGRVFTVLEMDRNRVSKVRMERT